MKKAQQIKKMSCEEAEKWFNDLIDGYLKGTTKTELEHHLEHCRQCFGSVELEKKLKERVRAIKCKSLSSSLRDKIVKLLDEA